MIAKNLNASIYLPRMTTKPQLQIPLVPEGTTVTYVHGSLPVFTHDIDDLARFCMFTSQLYINGSASQAEICRAFGVSKISVLRSVKLYREKGMAGFFAPRVCRGPAVLPPEVQQQVHHLLDEEHSVPDIAKELELKADTLHKALRAGKLRRPLKKRGVPAVGQR
nr:helix-turn-helix domain-containing protein [uncultured Desulfobulbus sp.]